MNDIADTVSGNKENEGESGAQISKSRDGKRQSTPRETRHVVIYGYTRRELSNLMKHFEQMLPEYVKVTVNTDNLVTNINLTGVNSGVELLRFRMNRYQQSLKDLFSEELIATEKKTVAEVMGDLLTERELTVSCAESCTGGNIAHRITQVAGSSAYFLGSVVSYSNDVKAKVLGVSRSDLDRYGAVSRQVAIQMARGAAKLMQTDCAIATTGIAGPDGGTKFKPVGTVWIAAKYGDTEVAELIKFHGNRENVIESATNHGMVMLIKLLRNNYTIQEEINDD